MSESSSSGRSNSDSTSDRADLTDLLSLSKKLEKNLDSAGADPAGEGHITLEPPMQETVTEFESLESLPPADPIPFDLGTEAPGGESFTLPEAAEGASPIEALPPEASEDPEFPVTLEADSQHQPLDLASEFTPPLASEPASDSFPPLVDAPPAPPPQRAPEMRFAASPASIPAAFPFTLKITGKLPPHHVARLESLLEREGLGVSAADLKPQLEVGRICIPRISEYAVILILQSLRDAPVEFEAHPSDHEEFTSPESPRFSSLADRDFGGATTDRTRLIDTIPVLPAGAPELAALEERERLYQGMDTLTASLILQASVVRSPRSEGYLEAIERLKSELRHKAFWKGADTLLDFSIQLHPVSALGAEGVAYRVTASGCAARKRT